MNTSCELKRLNNELEVMLGFEADDPWQLAYLAELTPFELAESRKIDLKIHYALNDYEYTLTEFLREIVSKRPYLDLQAQFDVYWRSPMESRSSFK